MQNGIAERTNRTLLDLARTLLIANNLPKSLWAEAIEYCVQILNAITIHKTHNKSAYELIYGKEPYLGKVHPFGTKCFYYAQYINKQKLDPRGKPGILVGFGDDIDGYRIWIPGTISVRRTKDVVFPEPSPFKTLGEFTAEPSPSVTQQGNQPRPNNKEDSSTTNETSDSTTAPDNQPAASALNDVGTDTASHSEDQVTPNEPQGQQNPANDRQMKKSSRPDQRLRDCSKLEPPDRYGFNFTFAGNTEALREPASYKEATESKDREKWIIAMTEEYQSMLSLGVWELTELPSGQRAIGCKWVYKLKKDSSGDVCRYKARLVLKGFSQRENIDYKELFSPVTRFETIRIILSTAAKERLVVYQFDVKTAFLYADLEEKIYMSQPEGFLDGTQKVCRLKKAIYGLKQAPRCFHKKVKSVLLKLKLRQSSQDSCVFYGNNTDRIIICLYVDDGIITAKTETAILNFLKEIQRQLEITFKPLNLFLGIQIVLREQSIFLYQENYIKDVLKRFNMTECKPVSIPIEKDCYSKDETEAVSNMPYRELIGSLMYLAIATRPDIAFAVGYLSRFLDRPTRKLWSAANRVLKYLKGTTTFGLEYKSSSTENFRFFSDADYASDPLSRKSTIGQLIFGNGNPVFWASSRQTEVSLSSTEAELIAATETAKSAVWVTSFLRELGYSFTPEIPIDNQSTTRLVHDDQFHKRTKHIEVRHFFIRELLENGKLTVAHVPTYQQLADILTKPLSKPTFIKLRNSIVTNFLINRSQ
jgi:hypothetical protein